MVDPVNLNIPGFDYLFFALLFFAVVALLTVVFARAELALQRERRARATENSALLESHRTDGGLEWIAVRGNQAMQRVRDGRTRQPSRESLDDLIEEAED